MKNKSIVLFDIDYTLFDTDYFKKSFLTKHKTYKEVIDVLEDLSKITNLGIFSEGELHFQRKKLKKTDIEKYFREENTHIVLDKLDAIKKILEKYRDRMVFFVDDKLSILFDAKKMSSNIFTIWVKRGIYAKNQKEIPFFKPDSEVENLSEIVKIVKHSLSS